MIKELNLSKNAITILEKRYLDPGETPYQRYLDMAKKIASVEKDELTKEHYADVFMDMFANQMILPNSPVIMNYGKEQRHQQGSACFVLSIKDDLNDIFDTIRKAALIHKTGGGTGFNFSSLRPNGALVKTTGKPSSGVIPFIKAYNAATGAVSQGGTRRGANMGILNVTHPDILEFIRCKDDTGEITNFNLSVGITERFMEAVDNDEDWELYFLDKNGERMSFYIDGNEKNPLVTERIIKARELYEMIVEHAHKTGEPGIIFLDRMQAGNSVPGEVIDTTNPCGEQPLPPFNSCVLASANLANHMLADWSDINWKLLDETVKNGVRLLDNIVTANEYPIAEIKINHDRQRRIGLGLTGLGDALIMMGLAYGSNAGREKAGQIMEFINDRSHYWSYQLGKERGNFELFEESKFNLNGEYRDFAIDFYKKFLANPKYNDFLTSNDYEEYSMLVNSGHAGFMRNAATTTIAPTGSLTSLLGCECYGGEPLFAPGYVRNILDGEELIYISDLFKKVAQKVGFYTEELMKEVARKGSAIVEGIPAKWQEVFLNANELSIADHAWMQAALQKHCDSGISKTINLASTATTDDVKKAYKLAYESGVIKGITVYRDSSRDSAPITIGTSSTKEIEDRSHEIEFVDEFEDDDIPEYVDDEEYDIYPISRPKVTDGSTGKYTTGCGSMYITVNHDEKSIIETFAFTGSNGGCEGLTEGLSRMISYTIRLARSYAEELGLNTEKVVDSTLLGMIDQLRSVKCNVAMRNKKSEGKSCPDVIGRALEAAYQKFITDRAGDHLEAEQKFKETLDEIEDCDSGCASCANREACHGTKSPAELEKETTKVKTSSVKIVEKKEDDKLICPGCGIKLTRSEGCLICRNCGYSKCN